ncbi:MAG: hypothetical protein L7U87_04705 [Chlamydiales bacterium]|nr:hypothetical protein [Chlamydiales bacterium]
MSSNHFNTSEERLKSPLNLSSRSISPATTKETQSTESESSRSTPSPDANKASKLSPSAIVFTPGVVNKLVTTKEASKPKAAASSSTAESFYKPSAQTASSIASKTFKQEHTNKKAETTTLSQMDASQLEKLKTSFAQSIQEAEKNKDPDKIEAALQAMIKQKISPTTEMYNALLRTCDRCKKLDMGKRAYRRMVANKATFDDTSFSLVIKFLTKETDPKFLIKIHNHLDKSDLKSKKESYLSLISAYGKYGKVDLVEKVYQQLKDSGTELGVKVFNALITAYARCQNPQLVKRTLLEAKNAGIKPNLFSYNIRLHAFAMSGMLKELEATWKEIQDKWNISPDIGSYGIMLKAYADEGMMDRFEVTLKDLEKKGLKIDSTVFCIIVDAYAKYNNFKQAEKYLMQAEKAGGNDSKEVYNPLAKQYLAKGNLDRLFELFDSPTSQLKLQIVKNPLNRRKSLDFHENEVCNGSCSADLAKTIILYHVKNSSAQFMKQSLQLIVGFRSGQKLKNALLNWKTEDMGFLIKQDPKNRGVLFLNLCKPTGKAQASLQAEEKLKAVS